MSSPEPRADRTGSRARGRLRRAVRATAYWLAVVVIALALVVGFILFLESRDPSSVDGGEGAALPQAAG